MQVTPLPVPYTPSQPQRIFVTGLGAVTPLGLSVPATWQALLAGTDAITPFDRFDLGGLACTQAGQIRDFQPPSILSAHGTPDLAAGFAAAACVEALAQAASRSPTKNQERRTRNASIGLVAATNFGALDRGEQALVAGEPATPDVCRALSAQAPATRLAAALELGGPCATITLSCAAGAAGLAYAADLIACGRASCMLVVGYDALSRFAWSGLCALRTMTKDCVRPFDLNRSGTIFTEGAAALLLSSEAACAAHASQPLAELVGWGTNNNGFHMTAPAPRGAGTAQVMRQALARAGLAPAAIDHINAHGTGTKANDSTESQAIEDVFGPRAPHIPVTSIKGSLGHMLGAAGTIEAIASVLSLREQVIPPTTHFVTPDPACPIDLVANHPRSAALRTVLSNSAGIGGGNAAVIFSQA